MKVIQESWLRRNKKSNDSSLFPFYYKSTLLLFNYSDMSSSLRSHGKAPGFLSFTISQSLLKLMSMESVMPFNHLILCHPLLFLPSIFPSIRVFSNVLALPIGLPKYWSFTVSICPSSEYSGLIPSGNLIQHKHHVKFLSTCTQATPNKHGYLVKKKKKEVLFLLCMLQIQL